jgi:hypothetical protein
MQNRAFQSIRWWALLSGTLLPLAGLLTALHLLPPAKLSRPWPLSIGPQEVSLYTRFLDLLGGATHSDARAETLKLSAIGSAANKAFLEADGYADTIFLRPSKRMVGGFVLRCKRTKPFRGQFGMHLWPAKPEDIVAKYAEVVAQSLGLPTPELTLVLLSLNSMEPKLFLREQQVDEAFLEKRRMPGMSVVDIEKPLYGASMVLPKPKSSISAAQWVAARTEQAKSDTSIGESTLDMASHAAVLVVRWLMEQPLFAEDERAAHSWSTGSLFALHRGSTLEDPWRKEYPRAVPNTPDRELADLPVFQELVREMLEELREEKWKLKERFVAAERTWIPLLAREHGLRWTRSHVAREKERLLRRLETGDPFHDLPVAVPSPLPVALVDGLPVLLRTPPVNDTTMRAALARSLNAVWKNDTLVCGPGDHAVRGQVLLPKGCTLQLIAGARMGMDSAASLICQGPLRVDGTARGPVRYTGRAG